VHKTYSHYRSGFPFQLKLGLQSLEFGPELIEIPLSIFIDNGLKNRQGRNVESVHPQGFPLSKDTKCRDENREQPLTQMRFAIIRMKRKGRSQGE
jgi:hypothetical protein